MASAPACDELALLGESPEIEAMKKDVDEMAAMLEAYLAFARGDMGEQPAPTDMRPLSVQLARQGVTTTVSSRWCSL